MLTLRLLPDVYALTQLPAAAPTPPWAGQIAGDILLVIARTPAELSIVSPESYVPPEQARHGGWRCMVVRGPLDLALVGVMASVAGPLAAARVPIFTVATYDTDYVLVPGAQLEGAVGALRGAGHQVEGAEPEDATP